MKRNPNNLSRTPLSPYLWQFEAFKAAAESDRHAASRYDEPPVYQRDRRWIERGQWLGKHLQPLVAALRQLTPARRRTS